MPGETAAEESRGPVRRSGRQAKRTDKLEEFLSTTKRGGRRSAPASVESGDPPSQTPTDAETASEASFDGNAEAKTTDDKAKSPERRTRSGVKMQTSGVAGCGKRTRGSALAGGGAAAKDEGSSENEEHGSGEGPAKPQDKQKEENNDEKKEATPVEASAGDSTPAQPGEDSVKVETEKGVASEDGEEKDQQKETETEEESSKKPQTSFGKRGPIRTYTNKKKAATGSKNVAPAGATPGQKARVTPAAKTRKVREENEDQKDSTTSTSSSSSSDSDEGGYDPNALYCICRQKHNKRFMICCDRCEEWFHGDCVGITEARGRLMERNGEDYICPNCTAKKNQVVRPATTSLPADMDSGTPRANPAPPAVAAAAPYEAATAAPSLSVTTLMAGALPPSSAGLEEKAGDDPGIKGRIEKATNPTGKKKIKIFQPQALQQTPHQTPGPKAPASLEQKTPLNASPAVAAAEQQQQQQAVPAAEDKTTPAKAEEASLSKCIGPGCENNAQPDSVYCGNDCILRHAAAAMRSITDVKDSRPKAKSQKKAGSRSMPKRSAGGVRKKSKKSTEDDESDSEEDESDDDDDKDDEDQHAEERPPPPAAASWSSDHNYNAVTPEKTAPISPTVLNKTSPPKEEKEVEKESKEKEVSLQVEKPFPASTTPVKGTKKSPRAKGAKTTPKSKKLSPQTSSQKSPKKSVTHATKMTDKSKKPLPPSPFPPGPVHITGALRVTKSNFTIPKKQPQQKDSSHHAQAPSSSSPRVPSSQGSSAPSNPSQSSSSSRHPPLGASAHPSPPPNNQMRQNIRRSLTDILYKRVSDSDDLTMTEGEVGRLAVAIEKEMFNLCLNTDSKYKNKYRSLMFNLKDPKNKGLFYRVVWGEVSPFRLVRLSAEELLSKEISEWRKPEVSETQSTRVHSGPSKLSHRHESTSHDVEMEDAPPTSDGDVCISGTSPSTCMALSAEQEEAGITVSAQDSSVEENSSGSMPDIFSSKLKDTTAEHRTHLFDLNCKICKGQKSEDEPAARKAKLGKKPEFKPPRQEPHSLRASSSDPSPAYQLQVPTAHQHPVYQPKDPMAYQPQVPQAYQPGMEALASEAQPQLFLESLGSTAPPPQAPPPVTIPAVSSVTITRRDPRVARHSTAVVVTHAVPEPPAGMPTSLETPPVAAPVEVGLKGPLPMPPAPPSSMPMSKPAKSSTSDPPPEGETAIFLHSQEKIWKGYINMPSVAKFVTKAYLVSGSFEHLKKDLPVTIHVGGRISPNTVWDYVGKLKTSMSKELCLIRFHPATEEEEVAYVSLFSYFSSKERFGVVANNNRRIKDLYLIPLGAKDPLPSILLPFDGPGLEPARPNLLLGLLICQKDRKRPGTVPEVEDKRIKIQSKDGDEISLQKPLTSVKVEKGTRQSLEVPFSTTPPGSPSALSSCETPLSNTVTVSSVLSLSSVKASTTPAPTGIDSPSSSSSITSSTATPLQTILNTLFGKKKHDSEASNSPSDQGGEVPPATMLDPIVQQFGQISKERQMEQDEDDRPYDIEEEYDPSMSYVANIKSSELPSISVQASKQAKVMASEVEDVAYDPEDDSIFEAVKPLGPGQTKTTSEGVIAPQKTSENHSKQNEDHAEPAQLQMSPTTASSSFSVTDTLLTQPVKSLLASSQLLQLGKKVEELVKSSSVATLINQKRDPRQSRDPRQATTSRGQTEEDKEETPVEFAETALPSQPDAHEAKMSELTSNEDTDPPQDTETLQPPEELESQTLPFLDLNKPEVSIPLLGEQMEPDMEVNYIEKREVKTEETEPTAAETEMDKYSIWPNAASILKSGEDLSYEQVSQESTSLSYLNTSANPSTASSTIPVLTQNAVIEDTPSTSHMPHISAPSFQNEYRPPADLPPPTSFPLPHLGPPPMQGPPPMHRQPPMSAPPPMQGILPIAGPPPLQGPPPPIHVPPPMHGPPPMQNNSNQPYGPPAGNFPPYQGQWGSSQQQPPPGPPHQNIIPPRGPPPPFPTMGQRAPPPQIFDPPMPPQHIGQQVPPLVLPPPPSFDGQSNMPPPRFSGPPPPFNFSGSRGPPPHFTGPPPVHFDSRMAPPSHFPGPRGPPPSQFGDHGPQAPRMEPPRGPVDQYNKGMAQHPASNPAHMFTDNKTPPPPGPAYRAPPPSQYEDRRGPPSSGDMGSHFRPHSEYGASRPHPSPPHRGSFDDHRGPPPHQENRGQPAPQHFAGSDRYRLDRHPDDIRPVRHSGPLLPTPPEGPIPPPGRMGGHSPDGHKEDHWRRRSPDARRRSSSNREGSEPRGGERPGRFEGGHRDPGPSGSHVPPEDRNREASDDRRRDRERDGPHGSRPSWDRSQGKRWSHEREWDRGRERERDGERSRERERSRGRDGERHREAEVERHRETDAEKRRERDRERDRGRERDSDRRDYERDRGRNRDRDRERERDRERDRRRDRSRSRDRERGKERGKDRERERDRERDKDRDRRDRSRSREKREDRKESKHSVPKESNRSVEAENDKSNP